MKKVLAVIICLCFVFAGCTEKGGDLAFPIDFSIENFPTKEYGYPENDVMLINGEIYELSPEFDEDEILRESVEIKLDKDCERLEIALLRFGDAGFWVTEQRILSHTTEEIIIDPNIPDEEKLIGSSNEVQKFVIDTSDIKGKNVIFKSCFWENRTKPYSEIEAEYLLEIKIK